MWNDKESEIDLLGYTSLARTIAALIHEPDLSPLTVGVYGDWGAGKSSILKLIERELSDDKHTCCLSFNGWLFQGYEDTKSVLMQAIIGELQKQQPRDEVLKRKAKEMLRRVDWLKVARGTAGLAWMGVTGVPDPVSLAAVIGTLKGIAEQPASALTAQQVKSVAHSVKESLKERDASTVPEEIVAFREDFKELLKTAKVDRLVVLVDDLDRCLPDTAIETLEAIRLFFYVPGTVFVLAADEQMIAYAVRRHFPDLPVDQSDYTKNYLEKLIQVPFHVPPLGKTETRAYVTLLLAEYALKYDPTLIATLREHASTTLSRPWEGKRLDEASVRSALGSIPNQLKGPLLLADRISPVLAEGLSGNPRQIKRFLNTLMVRLRVAEANGILDLIDIHALAKLMLLERFDAQVYGEIVDHTARSKDGRVPELRALETLARQESTKAKKGKVKSPEQEYPATWQDNDWLQAWAKLDPSLGDLDLRPYIHVSREKTPGFTSEIDLSTELDQLAGKLASGSSLILAGLKQELQRLGLVDARKLFAHLADRARQAPSWKTKPREVDGMYELCKVHSELQQELVGVFENLPVAELGAWAATGMRPVLTEAKAKERFQRLLGKWREQQENPGLRKALEQLGDL